MIYQLTKDLINLYNNYQVILSDKWQSIEIDSNNPIVGIYDVNGLINSNDLNNLKEDLNPDLPWAEDHFQERIGGEPLNPGNQYKNWPFYRIEKDNELFRGKSNHFGKFSHSYMERIWCKGHKGIRFDYGDLNDIIERLKKDPFTRQAFLSIWHPEDQSNNDVRVPCTIGYWFYLDNDKLNIKFLIRSCDAVRHYKNDLYMTYRLLEHVSKNVGLTPGNLSYWIGSLHCFKSDLYHINRIIRRNTQCAATQ